MINQKQFMKAKIEALAKKDFKHNTILAPMEIQVHKHTFNIQQINRDHDGNIIDKSPLFSIFQENKRTNCLSKYKAYPQMTAQVANNLELSAKHKYQFRPRLAICICSYNQDKKMLQQSLKGIYSSLQKFQRKAGINEEQIVVVVIFDGIQKLHTGQGTDFSTDMMTFFDQIDYLNGSILREGQLSYERTIKQNKKLDEIDWSKTSSLTEEEIRQKTRNRFRKKYDEYMHNKAVLKYCKKKDRTYEVQKLNDQIPEVAAIYEKHKSKFIWEKLVQQKKSNFYQQNNFQKMKTKFMEQFDDSYKLRKQFIQKSYQQVIQITNKYFQSRNQSSLLYALQFRPNVNINNPQYQQSKHLNVLLCVKYKNGGKLSSHALFFLGLCQFMKPQLCMLLDVGLKPLGNSIYKTFEYMDHNPNTGGTCGYMGLKIERTGNQFGISQELGHLTETHNLFHQTLFSIQKAQMFQYHLSHLVDKPFQSFFNYIHVLPGAFSTYRYKCLQKKSLQEYLKPILFPEEQRQLVQQNRYLAQDRTLSLILKKQNYDFAYLPNAKAVVDPASNLINLLGQRRRWINGSWFAFFHVYSKRRQISDIKVRLQFKYYYFIHGLSYISPSIFFTFLNLTISVLFYQIALAIGLEGQYLDTFQSICTNIILFVYIFIVGSLIFLSMNIRNTDQFFQKTYFFASSFLGVYGLIVAGLLVYNLLFLSIKGFDFQLFGIQKPILSPAIIRYLIMSTIPMYVIHVLTSFKVQIILQIASSTLHYLFYAPTYLHILVIYAFSRIDDLSWGTKGLDETITSTMENQNKILKYFFVYKYMAFNFLFGIVFSIMLNYQTTKQFLITGFTILFFLITSIRFIAAMIYYSSYYAKTNHISYDNSQIQNNNSIGQKIKQKLDDRLKSLREIYFEQLNRQIQNQLRYQAQEQIQSRRYTVNSQIIRKGLKIYQNNSIGKRTSIN